MTSSLPESTLLRVAQLHPTELQINLRKIWRSKRSSPNETGPYCA